MKFDTKLVKNRQMWQFFSNFTANKQLFMNKLFLLDAYALIYRAYYAFIRTPRINSKGLNTSAILGFCNTPQRDNNQGAPYPPRSGFRPWQNLPPQSFPRV